MIGAGAKLRVTVNFAKMPGQRIYVTKTIASARGYMRVTVSSGHSSASEFTTVCRRLSDVWRLFCRQS